MNQSLPTSPLVRPSQALQFGISRPEKRREGARESQMDHLRVILDNAWLLSQYDSGLSLDQRLQLATEIRTASMVLGKAVLDEARAAREIESLGVRAQAYWWGDGETAGKMRTGVSAILSGEDLRAGVPASLGVGEGARAPAEPLPTIANASEASPQPLQTSPGRSAE